MSITHTQFGFHYCLTTKFDLMSSDKKVTELVSLTKQFVGQEESDMTILKSIYLAKGTRAVDRGYEISLFKNAERV